ncbi:unnamed protein product [Gordionus sp. m RMFG-2023]
MLKKIVNYGFALYSIYLLSIANLNSPDLDVTGINVQIQNVPVELWQNGYHGVKSPIVAKMSGGYAPKSDRTEDLQPRNG